MYCTDLKMCACVGMDVNNTVFTLCDFKNLKNIFVPFFNNKLKSSFGVFFRYSGKHKCIYNVFTLYRSVHKFVSALVGKMSVNQYEPVYFVQGECFGLCLV